MIFASSNYLLSSVSVRHHITAPYKGVRTPNHKNSIVSTLSSKTEKIAARWRGAENLLTRRYSMMASVSFHFTLHGPNLSVLLTEVKTSRRHFPRDGSVFCVRGWKILRITI